MKSVFYTLGAVFLSSIFPGTGHLFIGSRKRSYGLLLYTLFFPILLYRVAVSLFPQSTTEFIWVSSFLFLLYVAVTLFAVCDALYLLKKKIEFNTIPFLPKHRFGRFAVILLIVIVVNSISDLIAPRNIWFYQVSSTGNNMSPTLLPGDRIIVIAKDLDPEKLRNVVVTHRYSDPEEKTYIRRVTALPGEKAIWSDSEQPVPQGEIYLTGDNASNSFDSRHLGPFQISSITGRAAFIYFSKDSNGKINWDRIGKIIE